MTHSPNSRTVLICCSVVQAEVEALRQAYWPELAVRFQTSMLHMKPDQLAERLDAVVLKEKAAGRRIVLIYGDCCASMAALEARPGVTRTRANNCYDLLLGRDEYRRLAHEGAFFLLSEWTRHWREIFTTELGLNHDNASSLMQDMHRKLVYLDTGVEPLPVSDLQACAQYCGLPWEIRPVGLETLRASIADAMLRLNSTEGAA